MEKRGIVEEHRTPEAELKRADADWDKRAADEFDPLDEAVKLADPKAK